MKSEPVLSVPFILHGEAAPVGRRSAGNAARSAAVLALLLLCGPAFAATKPPPPAAPSARVSTVTVTASREVPHVQSTFPARGAKVAPGLLVLRVTYDTRMRPEGWSYAKESGAEYPDCAKSPRLLDDRRSFVLICRTLPNKAYAVWFNRPPLDDFASAGRRPAIPYELKFATSDDDPVRTLPEAMKADPALSTVANPVEPDGLATYGQDPDAPGP